MQDTISSKSKHDFFKNIKLNFIIFLITFILFLCIQQSIKNTAVSPDIKITGFIVLAYLAFKSDVLAENERISAKALDELSEKESFKNEIRTKLSSATLHSFEAMGYMWGMIFMLSQPIKNIYLFLTKYFSNKTLHVVNPYTDWVSISITSFANFTIQLYYLTLNIFLELIIFVIPFSIFNFIFLLLAKKFVNLHKSIDSVKQILDKLDN
ncbi:hypothetical protein I6I91_02760 [Pediococcus pentosaceus]|uniref:hypothetical protein n=1 Tax=Pediococcus pentosaceus TaxID=1255 RepID=UPI00191AE32D|nr:hypothetical protein [Pediococcus pentosaceus]QQT98041.1 hypothetical protein I6I91_02760 [Pediococcus pentosaceus]